MWGGLYGLSNIKIKGRWNPYIYYDGIGYSLERTADEGQMLEDFGVERIEDLRENIDYVRIYIPCEEQIGYAYIKQTPGKYEYTVKTNSGKKVKRDNQDMRIWYSDNENLKRFLYVYDREWFSNVAATNMKKVELQINNFSDFENKILKAEQYSSEKPFPSQNYIDYFQRLTGGLSYKNQFYVFCQQHNISIEQWEKYINTYNNYIRLVTRSEQGYNETIILTFEKNNLEYEIDRSTGKISDLFYIAENEERFSIKTQVDRFNSECKTMGIYFGSLDDPTRGTGIIGFDSGGPVWKALSGAEPLGSGFTESELLYDTNIWENQEVIIPIKNNIHEYQWKDCNISLISQSNNFNNISVNDEVNICYHTLDDNNNKSIYFYDEENGWKSRKTLSTEVSCRITNIDGDEYILKTKIPLGDFYIVQDENYIIPTVEKFINPLNSGMENRKILDNFQSYTAKEQFAIDVDKNIKSYNLSLLPEYAKTKISVYYNPKTMKPYSGNEYYYTTKDGVTLQGNFQIIKQGEVYYKWIRDVADYGTCIGQSVNINKNNFPYNFRLVGNTYIRDRYGEDQNYQIELYNCAILDNININLSAAGEPTTVNIKMKALTDNIGDIGRLTISKQLESGTTQNNNYAPIDILEVLSSIPTEYRIQLLYPQPNTIYCLPKDCVISTYPDGQNYTYLELFSDQPSNWEGLTYTQYQNKLIDEGRLKKNSLVLVKIDERDIVRDLITPSEIKNYNFAIGN